MKPFRWNGEKDTWLKESRGIGFDEIKDAIENNQLVAIETKKNPRYAHQKIYPDRKLRKKYQKRRNNEKNI
jgi:hypothetical protein